MVRVDPRGIARPSWSGHRSLDMKMNRASCSKLVFGLGIVGVIAVAASTVAAPPRPGSGCPRRGIYCLDVYDPVVCTNRFGQQQTYPNSCYAYVDCATNCSRSGPGVTE
jgi:hypothetical protein